ncbi:MAG: GNAT family N-acetyltransferase [Thermomicrobiales bacterium]
MSETSNTHIQIRHAIIDDVPAIAAIHVRAWQTAYRGIMTDDFLESLTAEQRIPTWTRFVEDPASQMTVLVATEAGKPTLLGFCSVCPRRDSEAPATVGEIYTLYVDPDRKGAGIGKALLAAGERSLREAGFTSATLWMLRDNAPSRAFYGRCGWRADGGTRTQPYGDLDIAECRLAKSLVDAGD